MLATETPSVRDPIVRRVIATIVDGTISIADLRKIRTAVDQLIEKYRTALQPPKKVALRDESGNPPPPGAMALGFAADLGKSPTTLDVSREKLRVPIFDDIMDRTEARDPELMDDICRRYMRAGAGAIDAAFGFAIEWQKLQDFGGCRMSRSEYVETNMQKWKERR